ncbi:MAG: exported protein of unknown function [Nitrospira sp.]|jgi:hypothetical protein|nr:exported protein of unknown function [Nitrospira sp.]
MRQGFPNPFTKILNSGLLGLALMGTMAAGCSSTSTTLQQTAATQPRGYVRLEEVADWEFEAAHPSIIETATLENLLRGIMISEAAMDSSNLPVDGSKPMTAFSDEDVRYLAPLLAQALSQAQPEYVVAFRLSSSAGSGSEPTAGTLYVRNDRLYFTLTEHNGSLSKVESSLFGSGRPARIVTITPESAGRIEGILPSIAQGHPQLKSLAIDYRLFAGQPEPASTMMAGTSEPASQPVRPMRSPVMVAVLSEAQPVKNVPDSQPPVADKPAAQASPDQDEQPNEISQELLDARQAMASKDAKISALRRDLESMREQLERKDKELRAVKTKQTLLKRDKRNSAELTIR